MKSLWETIKELVGEHRKSELRAFAIRDKYILEQGNRRLGIIAARNDNDFKGEISDQQWWTRKIVIYGLIVLIEEQKKTNALLERMIERMR